MSRFLAKISMISDLFLEKKKECRAESIFKEYLITLNIYSALHCFLFFSRKRSEIINL